MSDLKLRIEGLDEFKAAIEREKAIIGESRDRLRAMINDIETMDDVTDRAFDDLDMAIQTLSEQV